MNIRSNSPVGLAAIADATHLNRLAEVAENDAVILCAEAVERRVNILEALDVALLGLDKAGERLEDLQGGLLIDGAEVGLGPIGEGDALSHCRCVRPARAIGPSFPSRPD